MLSRCILLATFVFLSTPILAEPLSTDERAALAKMQSEYDYVAIAQAYADYMIEHGRDTYGPKHTPLFVTGMDRMTGKMISPPFAHVKRKPFMPGWERDRELRGSDRNFGNADPLDQLTLLELMHRLTEMTGEKRYAEEADKTAAWWMANAQTKIGLYPWGSHTSWNVSKEGGGGTFEFNHVWPYWDLNPPALEKYAMGLWDHYILDKKTGDFNRHANSHGHGPGGGMEFPWPGSAMIVTWVQAYQKNPDPEYLQAIDTILNRWESLRDKDGHLAPCSSYGEWAWYHGYMQAANRLDDYAKRIEAKHPELAAKMRAYGRKNDAAHLKVADNLLDIKRVGPVKNYLRATGGYNPDRLDIIGGPWQDRKDYAGFAVLLHERMKRNDSPALQKRYREAVLDTAEVYMSINPEVQWAVWGENTANAIQLMLVAHELTGNPAYLHRADNFARLAVDMFLDDTSPLPKLTSQDNYYEVESVTTPSSDLWMLATLELHERLATIDKSQRESVCIETVGGVWDCTKLAKAVASVSLSYGEGGQRTLFLSRRETGFTPVGGVSIDGLDLIVSDHVNSIPTLEEAKPFNGAYRRNFSGKHREPSTATYGGFKDVLDRADLLLVNHGKQAAKVTVTITYHDSWDDRETKANTHTLAPGASVTVKCAAPAKRFIRRIDFDSSITDAVKLQRFNFEMTPRSKLNPLVADAPALAPAFRDAEPRLVGDGLVVHLSAERLNALPDGSPVDSWPNAANSQLNATAEGDRRPMLTREAGRVVVRFDGRDDFLSISDHDALDLEAWTLIVIARPTRGPGVILSKTDERNYMANYRLQIDSNQSISSMVRGPSAAHNVNRQARVGVLNRFAVMAARFDPKAKGKDQITIQVDGQPAVYAYEDARGNVDAITHDRPLEIGRQPGREPRYFQGDITDILLYSRALSDEDMSHVTKWLSGRNIGED